MQWKHLVRGLFALAVIPACAADAPVGDGPTATGATQQDILSAQIRFAVRVEGISDAHTLVLPDGTTTAAPISPGMLVVASDSDALFRSGMAAGGSHVQQLAEDGNPVPAISRLAREPQVRSAEFLIPNLHYQVIARPGDKLIFATMFVHSNDLFYAFASGGLPLFDEQLRPISGDVTQYVQLWDAGTELNQAPGVGSDQAPRQPFPGEGTKTREPVRLISDVYDGFTYPATEKVIRVTVTPAN